MQCRRFDYRVCIGVSSMLKERSRFGRNAKHCTIEMLLEGIRSSNEGKSSVVGPRSAVAMRAAASEGPLAAANSDVTAHDLQSPSIL